MTRIILILELGDQIGTCILDLLAESIGMVFIVIDIRVQDENMILFLYGLHSGAI